MTALPPICMVGVPPVPVPESKTECGLPAAESVIESVPVRTPKASGVNTTLKVQVAPTPSVAAQLLVWVNSPVIDLVLMVSSAVPVFVRVTVCDGLGWPTNWLPNVTGEGENKTPAAMPVPVKGIVWGLPAALSAMLMEPVLVPVELGLKVMPNTQFAEPPRVVPQEFEVIR